jgi:hypothetical protein
LDQNTNFEGEKATGKWFMKITFQVLHTTNDYNNKPVTHAA